MVSLGVYRSPPVAIEKLTVTVKEAARMCSVSEKTILRRIADGSLSSTRTGPHEESTRLVFVTELHDFLRRMSDSPRRPTF